MCGGSWSEGSLPSSQTSSISTGGDFLSPKRSFNCEFSPSHATALFLGHAGPAKALRKTFLTLSDVKLG